MGGFFFSFSFCFRSHCWHQRKERNRSRQTAHGYLLVLAICLGTGNIISSCACRQSLEGHAPGKVRIQALQGRQRSWELASRVGTRHLQKRLSSSQSWAGLPGQGARPPYPAGMGGSRASSPRSKCHEPGCASTRMDAPGQRRPTINALNAPGAC